MEIDRERRERLERAAEELGLDLVLVFGSRARGTVHEGSDLDLAVGIRDPTDEPGRHGRLVERLLAIQDALHEVFPEYELDVVELRRTDPLLRSKIFESPILLHGAPGRFEEERRRAFHRIEDYRPFLRMERDAVRRRLGLDAA